jgi:hypothetical protein
VHVPTIFFCMSPPYFCACLHHISVHVPDLGSITFKCNRLHYNYFAIFMITLHHNNTPVNNICQRDAFLE